MLFVLQRLLSVLWGFLTVDMISEVCMVKKIFNAIHATALFIIVFLSVSCFSGAVSVVGGEASDLVTQTMGSASVIASLESSVGANGGWNSSLQSIYDGIVLGQTTVGQLQGAVDAINVNSTSAAESVFYWYFELAKFGVAINVTTVEAALNEVSMLPSGRRVAL